MSAPPDDASTFAGPFLQAIPPKLTAASLAPDSPPVVLPLKLCNLGPSALKLHVIAKSAPGLPVDVQVDGAYSQDYALPANPAPGSCQSSVLLAVRVSASSEFAPWSPPVGMINVSNQETSEPLTSVDIVAPLTINPLALAPPDQVKFGAVALPNAASATVTVTNHGEADLVVVGASISDDAAGEFHFADSTDGALFSIGDTLAPDQQLPIHLVFKPKTSLGAAAATLNVYSKGTLSAKVALAGSRLPPASGCAPKLVQPVTLLGAVPNGMEISQKVAVTNTGAGTCQFTGATVHACGVGAANGFPSSFQCTATQDSYISAGPPAAKLLALGPGETAMLPVQLDTQSPYFGMAWAPAADSDPKPNYAAFLRVAFADPATGAEAFTDDTNWLDPSAVASLKPNLLGTVVQLAAALSPSLLAVGDQLAGCSSAPTADKLGNLSSSPFAVTAVALQNCKGQFALAKPLVFGPDGIQVKPNAYWTVEFVFAPAAVGDVDCDATFETTAQGHCTLPNGTVDFKKPCTLASQCLGDSACHGASIRLALHGSSTANVAQSETVALAAADKVDVVAVVDAAPTMFALQVRVANAFAAALPPGPLDTMLFQIAVVAGNSDVSFPFGAALDGGTNSPIVVTKSTLDPAKKLSGKLQIGNKSQVPAHLLDAAVQAVSAPLASAAGPCGGKCPVATTCTWKVSDPSLQACAGANWPIFRDDARLELMLASNGDDDSPLPVSLYVLQLAKTNRIARIHVIAGGEKGCNANGILAAPSPRLVQAAALTGGTVISACDVKMPLNFLADSLAGLPPKLYLQKPAAPATIKLSAGAKPCLAGDFAFDAVANALALAKDAGCLAGGASAVSVSYDWLCANPVKP